MTPTRPPAFFVGEHLALDFLNTVAVPRGQLIEWLADGNDLVAWLQQAGVFNPAAGARMRKLHRKSLDEVAHQAREFRQWLRGFVTARMGKPLRATTSALAPLNQLLARDRRVQRVELAGRDTEGGHRLRVQKVHRWQDPGELLDPIAAAAADLICNQDFRRIRLCEGSACMLLFLDRTKAHARRWCSMAVCGNRAKAAAHRARKAIRDYGAKA
jgi:predicted RNA-binding Zn ribbon-like protein